MKWETQLREIFKKHGFDVNFPEKLFYLQDIYPEIARINEAEDFKIEEKDLQEYEETETFSSEFEELPFEIDLGYSNDMVQQVVLKGATVKCVAKHGENEYPALSYNAYCVEFIYREDDKVISEEFDYTLE